jgi:hypothetical protein
LLTSRWKNVLSYKELLQKLHGPGNGLRDIYKIDISALNSVK